MPTLRESGVHRTDSLKLSRTQYKMLLKPLVVTHPARTDARTELEERVGSRTPPSGGVGIGHGGGCLAYSI